LPALTSLLLEDGASFKSFVATAIFPVPSLLFVNQHYYPDFASTAQHLTDLAEYLAADGFEVDVLCSRGHYLSGEMDVPAEEIHNGVHIRRVRTTAFGRSTNTGRIADYASFFLPVLRHLLTGPSYDAVITLTTPPLLCVAPALAQAIRGQSYGVWSMDLHPDAEEAVGMISEGGVIATVLHKLNDWGYRNADFVVDLGRFMKQRIAEKGVSREQLHTIPVWNQKDEIYPVDPHENPLLEELDVDLRDKFVVMYSGNAGLAHRFDEVLGAMRTLRNDPDIFFLFVGSGPKREKIESFIAENGLSNAAYLDYFPRDQIKYSLSLADVHLVTLRTAMSGIAVPGKLYGILASGRPALMIGPQASELGETIQSEGVGIVVDPQQSSDATAEFVSAIQMLRSNPGRRRELGERGRQVFLDRFERGVACSQWSKLLREQLT